MSTTTRLQTITAAECARRTGLTIRALRLYERHGLIRPDRTAKNWRVYGSAHVERLTAIVTLKSLGFSLAQIAAILKGRPRFVAPSAGSRRRMAHFVGRGNTRPRLDANRAGSAAWRYPLCPSTSFAN